MARLVRDGTLVTALATCSLAFGGVWPWMWHVVILTAAGALYIHNPTRRAARVAALLPGVVLSSANSWSVPFRSMLSRLPGVSPTADLPPLWAEGGIALVPILVFAGVQIWLIGALAKLACQRSPTLWRSAGRLSLFVTAVSIVAGAIATVVGVVLAGQSVKLSLFPRDRYAYFGLFWMSVDLAFLHAPLAVLGGIIVRRFAPAALHSRRQCARDLK